MCETKEKNDWYNLYLYSSVKNPSTSKYNNDMEDKMEEHLSYIKEFERNQKWFTENFKRILKEYSEKFVAV